MIGRLAGPLAVAREPRGRRLRLMAGEQGAERGEIERRIGRLAPSTRIC
ncbi:hypothetical protein ACFSTI_28235 [Rhizorhabdus histidinilytica]